MTYCVYIHQWDNYAYVGKGRSLYRPLVLSARNTRYSSVLKKYGKPDVIVYKDNLPDSKALTLEIEVIAKLRSQGIKLLNMTDGGEGVSGHKHSTETRIKMSNSRSGVPLSIAHRNSLSTALAGTLGSRHRYAKQRVEVLSGKQIAELSTTELIYFILKGFENFRVKNGYYCRAHNLPQVSQGRAKVDAWFEANKETIVQDQLELLK